MNTALDNTLRATARLVRLHVAMRAAARSVTAIIIALLLAVALDAMLGLPMIGLIIVDVLLLLVMLGAVGFVVLQVACEKFDRQRTARMIEDRLELSRSDLINAVQFSAIPADATSIALRQATIERGSRLASTLIPSRIIDKRPTQAACGFALIALLIVFMAWSVVPSVFATTLSRYLNPLADLPPFTLVNFHFDHPQEVYEGEPADIRVTLTGSNLPQQANVIFVSDTADKSAATTAAPMLRVGNETEVAKSEIRNPKSEIATRNSFLFPIPKADRTRTFYIDTPAGRSEKRRIKVLPVPRFESVMVTYDPPAYTGWKRTTEYLSPQGIRALKGTKVTLTIKSNLPLEKSLIRFELTTDEKNRKPETKTNKTGLYSYREALKRKKANPNEFPPQHDSSNSSYGLLLDWHLLPYTVLPLADDPTSTVLQYHLVQSVMFSMDLVAANPQRSRSLSPLTGRIEVVSDAPPRISIVEPPERQIIAPVGWKVPVVIEAEDDVKISRITLFHGFSDAVPDEVPLSFEARSVSQVQAKHVFDLAVLDAKAGDVITFFATAHDNYPFADEDGNINAGWGIKPRATDDNIETPAIGQFTDTPTYVIHVISMEDYQNHARSEYQMEEILAEIERFDALLRALDKQREELLAEAEALQKKIADQGGVPTAEDEKKLAQLNEKLAQYAEDQWKLAKEMRDRSEQPNLYDFERAYAQMLAEQANQLDRGAEDATKLRRENEFNRDEKPGDKGEALRHLQRLAQQLKGDEARLDEAQAQAKAANQDMELIAKADRIMTQAQRVPSLAEAQRDLANRLAPFKDRKNLTPAEEIRAQRLAMEQQALKEELAGIVKELEAAADGAESQLPNMSQSAREIAARIRELNIEADQAGAEESAMQGDGGKAHALADGAATKLESMLQQSENMGEQAQSDFADAKFQLQRQSPGQGLRQLSQGRNLPKLGEGQPGQSASNNPGQTGKAGSQGARGKVSVYGPRSTGQSGAQRRGGRDGAGRGTGATAEESHAAAAESLSPDSATQRGSGAAPIPGVPQRYRDLAEQYFRRLAEEAGE